MSQLPFFDAHVDSLQAALDLGHDLGRTCEGHLDLARGRRGGLGAVVLVAWVDPVHLDAAGGGGAGRTRDLIRELHRLARRHPEEVRLVGNGRELEEARAEGRVAAVGGIEGGHSIEGSIERLEEFFRYGVRVLTLVWNNHLPWIRSCQDGAGAEIPAGLSEHGRAIVRRMNELGIVVDLSHAGERSFYDALDVSAKPPIASHGGCRALHDRPRNLSDAQLRALGEAGGVSGIVFLPGFLDAGARAEEVRLRKTTGYREAPGANATARHLARSVYLQRNCPPTSLQRVVDHIVHAAEVAGVEHVGVGSDFDGIDHTAEGLEDASCYGALLDAMLARGFSEEEALAVAGGNMRRVFAEATGPGTLAAEAAIEPLD